MIFDLFIEIIRVAFGTAKTDALHNWKQRVGAFILIVGILVVVGAVSIMLFA